MSFLDDIVRWLGGAREETLPEGLLTARAASILSVLPFPFVVCDKNRAILAVSNSFKRLLKVTGKLKGKNLEQVLGGAGLSLIFKKGSPDPMILRGDFPRVGEKTFQIFVRIVHSGQKNIQLFLFQDVTQPMELQRMIEKSRSELLSVFDGIDDPMVMIDRNLRIRRINEAMLKALGGSSYQGFIGKACYWKLHGRNDICPGCTVGKTFGLGRKTRRMGLFEARPNPEDSIYQITCYPLKDPDGKTTAAAECYRDITEVKRIEEELYESERTRIMEPLAAGIAHEVRNPLAVIRSTAQYCLAEVGPEKEMREDLQSIIQAAETANRVIADLIDFSRPQEVDFKRQPLKPILEEGLSLIKGRAKMQKVRVVKSIVKNSPEIVLDGKRFLQAIMNFLINSLDAMPGGGCLNVEVNRQNDNRTALVTIRDTGEGIPEEILPKILQPFYSTRKDGIGLGLPIAEGIIRSHGGRVQFKSWKGKGTEVTIALPVRGKLPISLAAGGVGSREKNGNSSHH